jgi:hypothetical protein
MTRRQDRDKGKFDSTLPDDRDNQTAGEGSSFEPLEPIRHTDLGLPSDYDPRYIPKPGELKRAAQRALDDYTAFLMLHQDDPQTIAEQLDQIADIVRASSQIAGEHQPKALRLGLALELKYWMARNAVQDWFHLIMPMLQTSLQILDQELQSQVYRAWGLYLFFTRDHARADRALCHALEYAEQTSQTDLMLLARAERFAFDAREMKLVEAQAKGSALLAEAGLRGFRYVQGRIHYALSMVFLRASLPDKAFIHAQQAYVYLAAVEGGGLAVEALSNMLGSLNLFNHCSEVYKARLFTRLDELVEHSGNPWYRAAALLHQATQSYHGGDYDNARKCALKSWIEYKALDDHYNCLSARHMLGLIQTKRQQWRPAERHLRVAYNWYRESHNDVWAVNAYHGLAFIPVEQKDKGRALAMLGETLEMAEGLPESAARENLVSVVKADIEKVRSQAESI